MPRVSKKNTDNVDPYLLLNRVDKLKYFLSGDFKHDLRYLNDLVIICISNPIMSNEEKLDYIKDLNKLYTHILEKEIENG